MKKNVVAMVGALALVAAVGLGSTFAYFTDKEEVTNVVTMGHVDITLTEKTGNEEEKTDGLTFTNLVPGSTVDKQVYVALAEKSKDAKVRVKAELKWKDESVEADLSLVELNLGDGWSYNKETGYYDYADTLSFEEGKASKTTSLFESVVLPKKEWGNEVADKSFEIVLSAQAVQADAFDGEWPENPDKYVPASAASGSDN